MGKEDNGERVEEAETNEKQTCQDDRRNTKQRKRDKAKNAGKTTERINV